MHSETGNTVLPQYLLLYAKVNMQYCRLVTWTDVVSAYK